MDEEKLIRLIASLEKKLIASRIDLSKVDLIIHYYIGWTPIDIRDLPIKVVVHIFTQNQSNTVDMDFYYRLTDRLTSYFNIFSIDGVELVYSTNPVPADGITPLEQRIFRVIEKPLVTELRFYEDLDF
jgi:hypothetical protein